MTPWAGASTEVLGPVPGAEGPACPCPEPLFDLVRDGKSAKDERNEMWDDHGVRQDVMDGAATVVAVCRDAPVMVAVSGEGCDAAIRFAVAEAARGHGSLHVVHVVVPASSGTPASAAHVCLEAVDRVRDLVGEDVPATSQVVHGDLVDSLVILSRQARLVVLQRGARGLLRTKPRPICVKLASRAAVPVTSVPSSWFGVATGTVTVGVDVTTSCLPLVRQGLREASMRGSRLRIVHVDTPSSSGRPRADIRRAVAEAGSGLDAVPVDIEIVDGSTPVDALVLASESSELVVLGRHHPLAPQGSRLGPVARRVMRESACPVLLATPSASTSSVEWMFEGHLA